MEKYPKSVSIYKTKKIFEQMEKSIYKIHYEKGKYSIGFFCYIKNENKNIPVLIMDKILLKSKNQKKIIISINNKNKYIEFGDIIFTNKNYNFAIIEVKENMISNLSFLDLDDNLYEKDSEMYYYLETIYIIHFNNKDKNISVSYSTLNNINNSKIKYSCNLFPHSNFSPVFNLSNNKIIGINECNSIYDNKGIFLKMVIKNFINSYKTKKNILNKIYRITNNNNNIINIIVDATNFKEKEKIFFLENYKFQDKEGKFHFHDNLKELNDNNTELFINNKKVPY